MINPNLADAYVELEKVYYHIGLPDKAVDADAQVQRLDPQRRYRAPTGGFVRLLTPAAWRKCGTNWIAMVPVFALRAR